MWGVVCKVCTRGCVWHEPHLLHLLTKTSLSHWGTCDPHMGAPTILKRPHTHMQNAHICTYNVTNTQSLSPSCKHTVTGYIHESPVLPPLSSCVSFFSPRSKGNVCLSVIMHFLERPGATAAKHTQTLQLLITSLNITLSKHAGHFFLRFPYVGHLTGD